ncbi:MAG: hypothetical protein GC162_09680 [Planctomycetes bacterium]|nr:hypothetical protein [Planctomycetota bacterium]
MKTHALGTWMFVQAAMLMTAMTFGAIGAEPVEKPPIRPSEKVRNLPAKTLREVQNESLDILLSAASDELPLLRANALEAMQIMPDRALPLATKGLADENPAVRYVAVVTAGVLKFKSLAPAIKPLLKDANPSVRAAAIYSLYSLGEEIDLTPLADYLAGRDPAVRANVAQLLGLLGDKSAIPMLKKAANEPMPRAAAPQVAVVRIQIAEAIAKLGDDSVLDALRAGAFSQFDEVRVVSILAMGEVGDRKMEVGMEQFLTNAPVELRLAAAGALAKLGNLKGMDTLLDASGHENPVVRGQAAVMLGYFKDERTFAYLRVLMDDPNPLVRVSAAAAVLRRSVAMAKS